MKSPWKWCTSLEAEREYIVLASSIPPESRRSTWRLFLGASAVRKKFANADPHGDLMRKLSPEMGSTKFVRWTIRGAEGQPSWDDALQRLN